MRGLTRRGLLQGGLGIGLAGLTTAAYARYVEPAGTVDITRYRLSPRGWPPGQRLTIAALADLHCGSAHMSLARIEQIVRATHALEPDVIVLLGDYVTRDRHNVHALTPAMWARALGQLKAPLGVHAILGNHEFWEDREVQRRRAGDPFGKLALLDAGVPVLENHTVRLTAPTGPVWLAGLADQIPFRLGWSRETGARYLGLDDLPGTLAQITDDAPVILLAHEPDIFDAPDPRIALTLAGHTHGGQIRLGGWAPYVPSRFGNRFAYGHIREHGHDMIVSAGLGTSGPPVRFGAPPEIVFIALG